MQLRPYSDEDLWLTEALECDPDVMRFLGGPMPREKIPEIHRRRVQTAVGGVWYFTIIPDEVSGPAGTVGIWPAEWEGTRVFETGWMILPAFQGRGIASAALGMVIDRARADGRFPQIHAYPSIHNEASNAICRKFGFILVGECDGEYAGRPLRTNHWCLDLAA